MYSLYTYNLITHAGRKVIVIEDLATTQNPDQYLTVTNNVENVMIEIAREKKLDPKDFIIIYRDTDEYWDGWDATAGEFIILRCKTVESALARVTEKLFPHHKSNTIMNDPKNDAVAQAEAPATTEFKNACRPLIKYLADHSHPHAKVLVTSTGAELLEGVRHTGDILDYLTD